jgi:hypothetical protein
MCRTDPKIECPDSGGRTCYGDLPDKGILNGFVWIMGK